MRKSRIPIGVMASMLGLLLYGCASVKDVEILDKEADRLYAQSDASRKDIESLKREFSAFREGIQRDLAALQKENQNLRADLSLRIDTLQSEVRVLTSGVEEYKDVARKPSKELDRMKEDVIYRTKILEEKSKSLEEQTKTLDDRLKGLEGKIDHLAKQADSDKSDLAKGKESAELKASSTGAASLYKDAYEAFQKGDLDGARLKFEVFLRQYPNTELSDNAQFWIGETFYQKKDYEKAILEYEKVIVKYPEGEKVSSALYKQGIAFLELGDKTNARNLLKRVMEKYPQSEQAEMAKKRLETIK